MGAPTDKDFDVVYFLNCKPVKPDGSDDPNGKWRSAVVHFAQVNTITLNSGSEVQNGKDEFAFVTENNKREWEGFMYDVSFCQRHNQANHFRFMIDPRGSKIAKDGKWRENELCGFSAKVITGPNHVPERSKMIPIYRADGRKLMRVGSHDCYREYYCTWAPPPEIDNTWEKRNTGPIKLWDKEGKIPPKTTNLRRRIAADAEDSEPGVDQEHNPQPGDPNFVDVGDEPLDVEAPLDMTGGELKDMDANELQPLSPSDYPEKVEGEQDFDHAEGDDLERLYNDNEF